MYGEKSSCTSGAIGSYINQGAGIAAAQQPENTCEKRITMTERTIQILQIENQRLGVLCRRVVNFNDRMMGCEPCSGEDASKNIEPSTHAAMLECELRKYSLMVEYLTGQCLRLEQIA